ncbi:MAG: hypothetical protein DRN18_01485 [Thermoplasmata archaeon]|nr:MAG: hypothetical protein DRN18_01485 [Thermoplasmata archaeon]
MKKGVSKIVASTLIIIVTITMLLSAGITKALANEEDNSTISYFYTFKTPTFTQVSMWRKTFTRVEMEGCPLYGGTGKPRLPVKPLRILLPQETTVEDVIIEYGEPQIISMEDLPPIELGGKVYKLNDVPPTTPPDPDYDRSKWYPENLYDLLGVQYFRGFAILHINLRPVQYLDSEKILRYYPYIKLKIKTKPAPMNPLYRGLPEDKEEVMRKIDNYFDTSILETYEVKERTTMTQGAGYYEYVIITTEEFASYSGAWDLNDLINYRRSQGLSAGIKTVESIYSEYDGEDNQAKIRNYIKDAYMHGTTWVLLAGDVEYVPIRMLYDIDGDDGELESDLYYQCLDGNYNYDGDEYYGEKYDGVNGGWIDLYAEVWIGRASVDCGEEIENFVRKTIGYEETSWESDTHLHIVDSVGEYLWAGDVGGWGYGYLELCIDNDTAYGQDTHGIPSYKYDIHRLYEHDMEWDKYDIMNEINNGLNFINHIGHANPTYCMKLTPDDIESLTNDEYEGLWYSQGCHSGEFGGADECMSEAWVLYDHGGCLSVMNTGYGYGVSGSWDGPSNRYAREFFDALYYPPEGISRAGKANQDSKEDNIWHVNESSMCMYHCYYSINLEGDPYVEIKGAEDFGADFHWSPEYPHPNEPIYFFDDSIGAQGWNWDFGDGSTSHDRNPVHTYSAEGTYNVTLTIYGGGGRTDSCTKRVKVLENWPPVAVAHPEHYAGNNPTIHFDGSDSWDPDGTIVSYFWDFKDGHTSTEVSPTHTFSEDGIYNVTLTVTDDGGKTDTAVCDIKIDTHTPPVTIAAVEGSKGNNGWYISPVRIILSASDWSGVDYTKYNIDGGPWHTYTGPFPFYAQGEHVIGYYSVDIYGNVEPVHYLTVKIDTEKPELRVDITGEQVNGWYTTATITCSASDEVSGLKAIYYRIEERPSTDEEWNLYTGPITLTGDGSYIFRAYAEDIAGNTFGKMTPHLINVDSSPPETHHSILGVGTGENYYRNVTITLTATDKGIGVNCTYYRLDGGEWNIYTEPIHIDTLGSHTFEYYSIDKLGHKETVHVVKFNITNINFILKITNPQNGLYLFGNRIFAIKRTIIIGAITVRAELIPYDPLIPPEYDRVIFYIDGRKVKEFTSPPFEWAWEGSVFGKRTITVEAVHNGDSIKQSREVFIFKLL